MKKIELGRSMVEMLGVLAVMGILSITGIMGYQYAMTKRAANELANDLWVEAVNLSVQALRKTDDLKLASTKTSAGYDVTTEYVDNNKRVFEIVIDGVPYDVCRQMSEMSWNAAMSEINIGENGDENCVKDATHVMGFIFDAALDGMGGSGVDEDIDLCLGVTCGGDLICVKGNCECPNGQIEGGNNICYCNGHDTCASGQECMAGNCYDCTITNICGYCSNDNSHGYWDNPVGLTDRFYWASGKCVRCSALIACPSGYVCDSATDVCVVDAVGDPSGGNIHPGGK